jgi:hypothetical protein
MIKRGEMIKRGAMKKSLIDLKGQSPLRAPKRP